MMSPRPTHFIQSSCDRCKAELTERRVMSFFSNETICLGCSRKEGEIRAKIRKKEGADADLKYQGCGFLPKVEVEHKAA